MRCKSAKCRGRNVRYEERINKRVAEHFIQSFIGLLAPISYSLITQVQEPLEIGRGGVCVCEFI
jgi:hypothetical protein